MPIFMFVLVAGCANKWQKSIFGFFGLCLYFSGARLCRRPAAAMWTRLRLTLRAQPRSATRLHEPQQDIVLLRIAHRFCTFSRHSRFEPNTI
jgi:hypothetical protein